MAEIIPDKVTAEIDGEIVVFLIGMRINRIWKVWRWLPVFRAMGRMLAELSADPALGLLSSRAMMAWRSPTLLQYWKSAAHLAAYAHGADHAHRPAWQAFNQAASGNADVGIWHETYIVRPGQRETVYRAMPVTGLGEAGTIHLATGDRATAARRYARDASATAALQPAPSSGSPPPSR